MPATGARESLRRRPGSPPSRPVTPTAYNRLFSNRGRVLINGRSYPVVGRVCLDQSMVNLGPDTDVRVGDEVVLIGRSGNAEITCEEWAQALNTITYEVTCQINARVERIYE